jgi:hypothetical protein
MKPSKNTVTPRVTVNVSSEMANLRKIQGALNGFWQTSDLSYGFFLLNSDGVFSNKESKTVDLLGNIDSDVWYLNNQGRIKYDNNIGNTLEQVKENKVDLYRATLLSFYSAFEAYLGERIDPILSKKNKHHRWGPFVESLSIDALIKPECPVRLRTIFCADLIREIRNKIIHEAFSVPISIKDPIVDIWKQKQLSIAPQFGWSPSVVDTEIKFSINQVVGQAVNHVKEATKRNKNIPIELFYMLFTFTNLDSLAFETEEALLPQNDRSGSQVGRKDKAVRRRDLIIPSNPA